MIRVAFRYGDTRLFARLVCALQGGDSAHCEMVWQWDGDRHACVSASGLDGGVRGKVIFMAASKWRIYEVNQPKATVKDWFEANDGKKYDWLGLFGFVIRRIKGWTTRKFCSEAGAEILGLPDPWRFDPATLEAVCARIGRRIQ